MAKDYSAALKQASQNLKDRNQASGFVPSTPAYTPFTPKTSSSSSGSSGGVGGLASSQNNYSNNSSNYGYTPVTGNSASSILNSVFGGIGGSVNNALNQTHNYSPGVLAGNTAGFNGNNWNSNSGVLLNGKQVSHSTASGHNPLHVVNAKRQSSIADALKSGDWQAYRNFQGQQAPLHFEKDASGNSQYNKNYFAELLESSSRAMREAQKAGDTFGAGEWERNIRELTEKYNNAPGDAQYIAGINNTAELSNKYGIDQVGGDWFNSQWNNPDVRSQGYEGQRYWTQNPVFEDFGLLSNVLNLSNQYGDADEQARRQQINKDAMKEYFADDFKKDTQDQLDAQKKYYDDLINQLQQQQIQQVIEEPPEELPFFPGTGGGGDMSGTVESIFTPGASSNTEGYTQNQLVTNDLFNNYLRNIYQGGF